MKLIFMGTPEFAVPTLQALITSEHDIVAVYSQPPRPANRGKKLTLSPVQQLAEAHDIPVLTPTSLKDEATQAEFAAHQADAAIVVAYGLLLPLPILNGTKHGCINVHPSALPRWRGAAPIQRTLMAGDTKTAMCIMQMDEGLDTGDVILRQDINIAAHEDAGALHDRLAQLGAALILQTLESLEHNALTPQPQAEDGATYAKKIDKPESKIDWNQPAETIQHRIRGLSPYPGAYFEHEGERIKILTAELSDANGNPGEVLDDQLTIACSEGAIRPTRTQRPGKPPMDAQSFLRGNDIPAGTVLK